MDERDKRKDVPTSKVKEMNKKEFRRMLEKMSKPELHQFIKENKIKSATITPFSTKDDWVKEIMFHIFGDEDKYLISSQMRERNAELGFKGASIFGHRVGSVKAVMDRRFHEGVLIENLIEELMDKFEMIKDEKQAYRLIKNHIFYLPKKRRISIILTLTPDPERNHVVGVFDEFSKTGRPKKIIEKN